MHTTSGRWRFGLALALATALLWATLPVALKVALNQVDPITLTWARFVFALVVTAAWQAARGTLPRLRGRGGRVRGLLLIASAMLIGNYVLYLLGLDQTTPTNAQVLIQLAPLLMTLGGVFVFGEPFGRAQWIGYGAVIAGLMLFFRDQFHVHADAGFVFGCGLIVLAAFVWAAYALAQKQLLQHFGSQQVMLVIYAVAAIVLLPWTRPASLLQLDALHVAAVVYCALNTLAAYGAFAEALAHWEASRVSMVLALTPLLCTAVVAATHAGWPHLIDAERISPIGWIGASLVVLGSAFAALLQRRRIVPVEAGEAPL
jgi:drug/metabolite transporter (DMT)-like permease